MTYDIVIDGRSYRLNLRQSEGRWSCRLDGCEIEVDAVLARPNVLSLRLGNQAWEVKCERVGDDTHIWVGSQRFLAEVRDRRSLRSRTRAADDHGPKKLTAPMPGKVVRILLSQGAMVETGAGVLVVEAMKMQNEMKAPRAGKVLSLAAREGATVAAGEVLATIG